MTEAEWLRCTDPGQMLRWVKGGVSRRKLRLFACAHCRAVWDTLTSERSRKAVEVAERYVDGAADEEERERAWQEASARYDEAEALAQDVLGGWAEMLAAEAEGAWVAAVAVAPSRVLMEVVTGRVVWSPWLYRYPLASRYEPLRNLQASLCELLRDIIGNPFNHTGVDPFSPPWNDSTVLAVARAIYEERRFEDLPILADALEDAGCSNQTVLGHCRSAGPHVCGCWPVERLWRSQYLCLLYQEGASPWGVAISG